MALLLGQLALAPPRARGLRRRAANVLIALECVLRMLAGELSTLAEGPFELDRGLDGLMASITSFGDDPELRGLRSVVFAGPGQCLSRL